MLKSVLGVVAKLASVLGAGALSWQLMGKEAIATADAVEAAAASIAESLGKAGDGGASGIKNLNLELLNSSIEMSRLIDTYKEGARAVQELTDGYELQAAAEKENVDLSTTLGRKWADAFADNQRLARSLEIGRAHV